MSFIKKIISLLRKQNINLDDFILNKVKNIIIFESHPDLSGNSLEVFEELIRLKYNKKYKIYWLVQFPEKCKEYKVKNVDFIPLKTNSIYQLVRKKIIIKSAKIIITENRMIHKTNPKTISIHLHHGTVLKDISGMFNFGKSYNYILCPSDHLIELYKRLFKVKENQIIVNGYPRNDLLFKPNNTLEKLGMVKYKKVILWMPTFRQHKNGERNDTLKKLPLGIPIVYSVQDLKYLNKVLNDLNYLLVLKLHPSQDKSYLNVGILSNIIILEDEYLNENGVKLYEFIGETDALITDYSSIYYDYLLLNRPIGLTLDDLETYKIGFVYKNLEEYLIGSHMRNIDDAVDFIKSLENDPLLEERKQLSIKMNCHFEKRFTSDLFNNLLSEFLE